MAEDRSRFTEDWRREQSRFVDDPQAAVNRADTLVQDVMHRRGYAIRNTSPIRFLTRRWSVSRQSAR
jgi:hypothetical protein